MINVHARNTNTGPAAPVIQSAKCSTRLKHRMTSVEQLRNTGIPLSPLLAGMQYCRGASGICDDVDEEKTLAIVNMQCATLYNIPLNTELR